MAKGWQYVASVWHIDVLSTHWCVCLSRSTGGGPFASSNQIVSRFWDINYAFKKPEIPNNNPKIFFCFYMIFSNKLNIAQKMQIDDISGNDFNAVHSTCLLESHKHTLCVGECPQYPSNGLHNCSDVLQLIPAYHHEPHFIARPTSKKIKHSPIRLIPHPEQICMPPLLLRYCCGFQTPSPRRAAEVHVFPRCFLAVFPFPLFLSAQPSFCLLSVS